MADVDFINEVNATWTTINVMIPDQNFGPMNTDDSTRWLTEQRIQYRRLVKLLIDNPELNCNPLIFKLWKAFGYIEVNTGEIINSLAFRNLVFYCFVIVHRLLNPDDAPPGGPPEETPKANNLRRMQDVDVNPIPVGDRFPDYITLIISTFNGFMNSRILQPITTQGSGDFMMQLRDRIEVMTETLIRDPHLDNRNEIKVIWNFFFEIYNSIGDDFTAEAYQRMRSRFIKKAEEKSTIPPVGVARGPSESMDSPWPAILKLADIVSALHSRNY